MCDCPTLLISPNLHARSTVLPTVIRERRGIRTVWVGLGPNCPMPGVLTQNDQVQVEEEEEDNPYISVMFNHGS